MDIDKTIQNLKDKLKFFEDEAIFKDVNKILFSIENDTIPII